MIPLFFIFILLKSHLVFSVVCMAYKAIKPFHNKQFLYNSIKLDSIMSTIYRKFITHCLKSIQPGIKDNIIQLT